MSRRADVAAGLERVESRLAVACRDAGRVRDEVTLIVVTKFFPASDVRMLAGLGVRDVGENRHQEAVAKREECADLGLRWHFVGGLQSNKAAAVGEWADAVHSVDRPRVLPGLTKAAHDRDEPLDVLVQVSLDAVTQATGRGGVVPQEAVPLAAQAAAAEGLVVRGVMGVAPLNGDPVEAFARLAATAAEVRAVAPTATWISAGMSGDLEQAIRAGATHVRVGSAILGNRPGHG